ncbi:hypothetical protein LIA77_06623 [Sarocladium implicatum]|nr:hypothetical protein LIA77_06623 [Sarocladium implicatum]
MVAVIQAADIVYVTELEIYTLLAPCAAEAITYNLAEQTRTTRCGTDVEDQQSCICSSTAVLGDVQLSISNDIASSCGTKAIEDQSSASSVLKQYCNPDSTITFATPTSDVVQAYITELSEMQYLPKCAQSALSEAVMGHGSRCPEDASLYAPCVCTKDHVTSSISEVITKSVEYSCSNKEDITAAQDFYHEYCAMNNGTTSFAPPQGPPGDMTYYITAIPQFKSLNDCAQSAVSSALDVQTAWNCGSGPQALASCACLKSGMRRRVSSTLTSEVKYYCEVTATAEVTSALEVLDAYCSAAADEVTFDVDESVSESYAISRTGSGSSQPQETGGSNGGSGSNSGDNSDGDSDKDKSGGANGDGNGSGGGGGGNQTATIAASVLGGVVAIALVAGIWFWRRRQKKNRQSLGSAPGNDNPPGKPELAGPDGSSPAAGYGHKELSPQLATVSPSWAPSSELPAGPQTSPPSELPPQQEIPRELAAGGYGYGQNQQSWGQYPQQQQVQSSVSPLTPPGDQQGMGWQSGPVESYELDSNMRRH